ncbi:hypothetical protein [Saccharopolyspora hattusasensis]|uniref:hypothetical protein n=1 Tax=Saccharopolyspora hattusasensis TaxID=1128679 RepID=UPI003D98013B
MPALTATNANCLEGLACPSCRAEDAFDITVETIAGLTDLGVDHTRDIEWTETSLITPCSCQRKGTVEQFTVEVEDVLITDEEIENLIEQAGFGSIHWAESAIVDFDDHTYRVVQQAMFGEHKYS